MRAPAAVLIACLANLAGCGDPASVRPFDSDVIGDTDVDSVWDTDTDTDTDTEPRPGCEDGELDAGWALASPEGDPYSHFAPYGDQVLARNNAGVYLIDLDDWEAGVRSERAPVSTTRRHFPPTPRSTQRTFDPELQGRGLFFSAVRTNPVGGQAWLWNDWPDEFADVKLDADMYVEYPYRAVSEPTTADMDGDGLDDVVVPGFGVILSPSTGALDERDVESNLWGDPEVISSPEHPYSDWNDDGYADMFQHNQVWLGPLYPRPEGDEPDTHILGVQYMLPDHTSPPHDLNGDGVLELWVYHAPTRGWRSLDFPGLGQFDEADFEDSYAIPMAEDGGHVMRSPMSGDFDGDGVDDAVSLHAREIEPGTNEREGSLRLFMGSVDDGLSYRRAVFDPNKINDGWEGAFLGDLNGDGRDDFVYNAVAYGDEEAVARLWLGCEGW